MRVHVVDFVVELGITPDADFGIVDPEAKWRLAPAQAVTSARVSPLERAPHVSLPTTVSTSTTSGSSVNTMAFCVKGPGFWRGCARTATITV